MENIIEYVKFIELNLLKGDTTLLRSDIIVRITERFKIKSSVAKLPVGERLFSYTEVSLISGKKIRVKEQTDDILRMIGDGRPVPRTFMLNEKQHEILQDAAERDEKNKKEEESAFSG